MSRLPLTLLALAAVTMSCGALTLKELESSYEDKRAEITAKKDQALKTLRTGYLTALERIWTKYQRAGNLDAVLLTKDEAILIESGKWPLPAVPKEISLEVNGPRKIYLKNYLKIEQDAAKDLIDIADRMLALLDQQTTELTKSGDLQNAQLAQQIKKEITDDPQIAGARKQMQNVRSDGTSRPALRIRRYGDNIEVLVSYDMRGKISMESPVRNVEEADKSIGDTTAKVLGEFVGAEGYEVDSYLAFEESFEDGELKGIAFGEIEHEFTKQYGGVLGLRLNLKAKAKNPYGNISASIQPEAVGGKGRLTVKYFIPETNQLITGFKFVRGAGGTLGGHDFNKTGQWTTETITFDATGEGGGLLLYLSGNTSDKTKDPTHDPVVLGALKVEHIAFTSFIVQRLGEHGVITEEFKEPAKQPKLTMSGVLVTQ